jgi:peroxiredoxin family protein
MRELFMSVTVDENIKELIKQEVASQMKEIKAMLPEDRVVIVAFSGDFDKAIAALILATGAAAMGMRVTVFFTFWGFSIIKTGKHVFNGNKNFMQKMVNLMMPGSPKGLTPSKMTFGAFGAVTASMFRSMMKGKMDSVEDLLEAAKELEVEMIACSASMEVMGIAKEDLIDGVEVAGVAKLYEAALNSRSTFFV